MKTDFELEQEPIDFTTWRSGEIAAHREGWDARRRGWSTGSCPHEISSLRLAWIAGWQHANDVFAGSDNLAGHGSLQTATTANAVHHAPGYSDLEERS